jgi:ACR3 family arsenite transporter
MKGYANIGIGDIAQSVLYTRHSCRPVLSRLVLHMAKGRCLVRGRVPLPAIGPVAGGPAAHHRGDVQPEVFLLRGFRMCCVIALAMLYWNYSFHRLCRWQMVGADYAENASIAFTATGNTSLELAIAVAIGASLNSLVSLLPRLLRCWP